MYSNLIRLYTKDSLNPNNQIILANNQHHYLKNVMRVKKNDNLRIFNGIEGEWLAQIIKIQKKYILLSVTEKLCDQKNSPNLWLFFAPIKKDRINILVQKSTELGVTEFIPIQTKRSNIKNIKISNLQKNAIEASEQSKRLDIPIIRNIIKFSEIINFLPNDRCLLYCDEQNLESNNIINKMTAINKNYSKWSLIIGPEGGFSADERHQLLNLSNVHPVSLGQRILRADTAATVALYCIQQFINI